MSATALAHMPSAAPPAPVVTYISRQAIYDRHRKVWAYQLLHRASDEAHHEARRVVLTAALDLGLGRIAGTHRLLVGFDADALIASIPGAISPSRLIIAVGADIVDDAAAFAALRDYGRCGYPIALEWSPRALAEPELVALARLVRIDVRSLADDALVDQARRIVGAGKHLLAAGITDGPTAVRCQRAGAGLFQGAHLRTAETLTARHVAPEQTAALRLLAKLQDPKAGFGELSDLIHKDPVLSYQLLRFIGSAAFGRPVKVDSVQRALILLGLGPVRQWASLLVLAQAARRDEDALILAMTRAKMADILALRLAKNPTAAFTVGLFSGLEHVLGVPLAGLLAELPLDQDVSRALLGGTGYLGQILQTVLAYEDGVTAGHETGVSAQDIVDAYLDAVEWAEQARRELSRSS